MYTNDNIIEHHLIVTLLFIKNILSEETLEIYMEDAFQGGFKAAIQIWDKFKGDKHICDMLHCLKFARYRFFFLEILLWIVIELTI